MKDKRILVFRKALDELVESLDATLRIAAWDAADDVPQPLQDSASLLVARLGAADRLATGVFNGSANDKARVVAMTGAMRQLEAAYLAFRGNVGGRGNAQAALRSVLDVVRGRTFEAG